MDISSIVQTAESFLAQPYRKDDAHYDGLLLNIDDDIAHLLLTDQNREKLKELRERLLLHKADSQKPLYPGASTRNIF
jgi:hypothetical protein